MSDKKRKVAPKAAPKPPPQLKPDRATWGSARVHTAEVDLATAVQMQEAGYRIQERKATTVVMYGDGDAFRRWKGVSRG